LLFFAFFFFFFFFSVFFSFFPPVCAVTFSPFVPVYFFFVLFNVALIAGVPLIQTLDSISVGAFVQPNSFWWWGLRGNGGFYKAFSPLVDSLGNLLTDAVTIAEEVAKACNCMNNNECF
jgi:hypothetical protein